MFLCDIFNKRAIERSRATLILFKEALRSFTILLLDRNLVITHVSSIKPSHISSDSLSDARPSKHH